MAPGSSILVNKCSVFCPGWQTAFLCTRHLLSLLAILFMAASTLSKSVLGNSVSQIKAERRWCGTVHCFEYASHGHDFSSLSLRMVVVILEWTFPYASARRS